MSRRAHRPLRTPGSSHTEGMRAYTRCLLAYQTGSSESGVSSGERSSTQVVALVELADRALTGRVRRVDTVK
jgi:hypothetical protein